MRMKWIVILSILLLAVQANAEEKTALKTQKEKLSYLIGHDIGSNLKKQSIDVDPEVLIRGFTDALAGKPSQMSAEEMAAVKNAFRQEVMGKQAEEMKKVGEKNRKEGEAFLAENKNKEGVKALPSGLQYKVIAEGSGKTPKATDTVSVHYRGTLLDGTEFDSSHKRGEPAVFPVNGVIKGWSEALQLMKEGAKWQLFIPPHLAYGERGAGTFIGPNATLVFEVELISVK